MNETMDVKNSPQEDHRFDLLQRCFFIDLSWIAEGYQVSLNSADGEKNNLILDYSVGISKICFILTPCFLQRRRMF